MNEFPSWLDWLPDGMHSWEALVAVATGLLALATGWLGWQTRRLAAQTRRDVQASTKAADASAKAADVAEKSFATSIRPILVNLVNQGEPKVRPGGQHERLHITVPLRNVGGGLALLEGPSIEVTSNEYNRLVARALASAIPADEPGAFVFMFECENPTQRERLQQAITRDGFHMVARYKDLDGGQLGRTRAKCEHLSSVGWQVTEIELFRGQEPQPFAVLPGQSVNVNMSDDGLTQPS